MKRMCNLHPWASAWAVCLTMALSSSSWAGEDEPWWTTFGDEQLNQFVERARGQNANLDVARARADLSKATSMTQFAALLPTLQLTATSNVAPLNSLGFGFGLGGGSSFALPPAAPVPLHQQFGSVGADQPPEVFSTGNAQLQARWALDPGATFMRYVAAEHDVTASLRDADQQTLAVAQQITQTYFDVLAAHQQIAIVEQQIAAQEKLLKVVELRFSQGDASSVDVLQQRQQVAQAKSQVPTARSQRDALKEQLRVLLGVGLDDEFDIDLDVGLPQLTDATDVDFDKVFDERPDLAAAKARLSAAQSRTTGAWLSLLPTLTLSAQTGPQYRWITDYDDQWQWGVGATLSVPLFFGQSVGALRQSQLSETVAAATLRQAKLNTVQAVQLARVQERELRLQLDATRTQREAAEATVKAARERYASGLLAYQNVLVAENTHFISQISLLTLQRQLLLARLNLVAATAGAFATGISERPDGTASSPSSRSAP